MSDIPVNKLSQRVDAYFPRPPQSDFDDYSSPTKYFKRRYNNFHLGGGCELEDCIYSHEPLASNMLDVLRSICLDVPCVNGGACRRIGCYHGHACHRNPCDRAKCGYGEGMHGVDGVVVGYEPGRKT